MFNDDASDAQEQHPTDDPEETNKAREFLFPSHTAKRITESPKRQ
jgi:hypothetical protein